MKTRIWVAVTACVAASLAMPFSTFAASNRIQELIARARAEAMSHPVHIVTAADTPDFGTSSQIVVNIGAYEFQGASSAGDQLLDDGKAIATSSRRRAAATSPHPSGCLRA